MPGASPTATRQRPRLAAKVRPNRDRRRPYRFRIRGRVKLPSGVRKADGCRGEVRVRIKRKGRSRTVTRARAKVRRSCRFSRRVRLGGRRLGRRGTLRFTVRFRGNALLLPKTVRRQARYGR